MKRRRLLIAGIALLVFLAAYTLSYLKWSAEGRYEPLVYGLIQGPDDTTILAPKAAFGYRWFPFDLFTDDGRMRLITVVYLPLIKIDQSLWHTEERMESGRYRVKNYFDYDTLTYRDIEPK